MRRLLLALAEAPERFGFHLAWSRWRRCHQARAKRAHVARRATRPVVPPRAQPTPSPRRSPSSPELRDEQWQRVHPLLPPQRPPRGRPNHDHRQMVAAMLWVERTGCSWRSLPSHFGPWQGVYARYQRWRNTGLWARILDLLDQPEASPTAA